MKSFSTLSIHISVLVYCLVALFPYVTLCQNSIYEDKYPNHLQAYKLLKTQKIVIDGKLNDDAWQRTAKFQDNKFVDITKHLNASLNKLIPSTFQVDVATLYDDEYLYIGARVYEPFQFGTITGHNIQAPYHDNDFEVFIDVSGTTEYYKEFEMNILNATYDVNWGVPDQDGLNCDKSPNRSAPYIPVCVNTTFPSYSGNWSMQYSSSLNGSINSPSPSTVTQGLQTATSYNKATFGKYLNNNFWTLEIAFPIKASSSHGGLLDKDLGTSYPQDKFHPAFYYLKNDLKRPPLYWLIDFARAEHPRKYIHKNTNKSVFCPFDCTHVNEANYNVTLTNPTSEECEFVQKQYPTLLGHSPWNCYFEWVFQDVGDNNYMHRPSEWAFLEFVPSSENDYDNDDKIINVEVCKNIEFVGRHVMNLIHKAEKAYFDKNDNTYTEDFTKLLQYCGSVSECEDLHLINVRKDVFPSNIRLNVTENISKFTENCTNRPCFQAGLFVVAPLQSGGSSEYIITMTDNLLIQVKHFEYAKNRDNGGGDLKLCLK